MTTEQSVLLKLIRQSQFDTIEDIAWDDIDLDALYEETNQQALLGLIAPLIPAEYSNDTWRRARLRQEASYIRYCFAQDELKKVLDDANIPFVILKGNAAAIYYKESMRRAMGDIDFIVPQDRFEDTKAVLTSSGYVEGHFDERHIGYKKNGVSFELHHHYSIDVDIEDYILSGLKGHDLVSIDNHQFPILPKIENGLVLLVHMRSHLKTGLGLRQLIDWMTYANNNLYDDLGSGDFIRIVREKGLESLSIVATRTCQLYLGLTNSITWCANADTKTCEQFIQCLITSGNFGRKNGSGNSIETVSTSIKRKGLFRWLQLAGEHNWKSYHKHRWLKPFCWLYQIGRYAKQGITSGRDTNQLKSDFDRSDFRYELLRKLEIS